MSYPRTLPTIMFLICSAVAISGCGQSTSNDQGVPIHASTPPGHHTFTLDFDVGFSAEHLVPPAYRWGVIIEEAPRQETVLVQVTTETNGVVGSETFALLHLAAGQPAAVGRTGKVTSASEGSCSTVRIGRVDDLDPPDRYLTEVVSANVSEGVTSESFDNTLSLPLDQVGESLWYSTAFYGPDGTLLGVSFDDLATVTIDDGKASIDWEPKGWPIDDVGEVRAFVTTNPERIRFEHNAILTPEEVEALESNRYFDPDATTQMVDDLSAIAKDIAEWSEPQTQCLSEVSAAWPPTE